MSIFKASFRMFVVLLAGSTPLLAASGLPTDWIDPATGHRVIRLSQEPGTKVLYFHQNSYTESGDKLVVVKSNKLEVVDLKTREIAPLGKGIAEYSVVGNKSRQVYYTRDGVVYCTHIDTGITREIARLGPDMRIFSGLTVNANETLLAGSYEVEAPGSGNHGATAETKFTTNYLAEGRKLPEKRFDWYARLDAKIPMRLFTVGISSGEVKTFHPSTEILSHVQFSPTDSTLIMFCHDGPWHKVDRIWTIRTDGSELQKIHTRTMEMEIAGHEFFSHDGKIIWYDLQTPKSEVFWLAGHVLATGEMIKYRVKRENWSVHYGESPNGELFAGDGSGPESVAERKPDGSPIPLPVDGQWIFLFTPKDGQLQAERLVDLGKHDYRLEPNLTFTPDGKWIVFQSNMQGAVHTYAVEVKKAGPQATR